MRNKNLRYYLCSLILLVLLIAPIKEVSANYKSVSAGGSSSATSISGITFNSTSAATANAAAINSALTNGGNVQLNCAAPNTLVYVNNTLTIKSNTDFYISPNCIITALGNIAPIVQNAATASAWTTLYNNSGVITNGPLSVIRQSDTSSWATSQSYSKGVYKYTAANQLYWESATTCTSNSSGTGPSGTGTGITDGTCTWNYVTTHIPTGFNYPTIQLSDPTMLGVINWPSHGQTVGNYVFITPQGDSSSFPYWWSGTQTAHTRGGLADSAYFGLFPIIAVNDSNNVTVVFRRAPASAFTGIPMLIKQADMNISVTGEGIINGNYPTNSPSCTTSQSCHIVDMVGVENLKWNGPQPENGNRYAMNINGIANSDVAFNVGPLGNVFDAVKVYGPAFDTKFHDISGASYSVPGASGDDFFTLQAQEDAVVKWETLAAGDILNISLDNINSYAGLGIRIYFSNPNLLTDQIDVARISGINGDTVTTAGPGLFSLLSSNAVGGSSSGGNLGTINIHNIDYNKPKPTANLTYILNVNASGSTIGLINFDHINLQNQTYTGTDNSALLRMSAGTVNQVNASHIYANSPEGLGTYISGGTISQYNAWANNLIVTDTGGSGFFSCSSPATVNSVNLHDNYVVGSMRSAIFDNCGIAHNSVVNNYFTNNTNALLQTNSNGNIYVANNYDPSLTQGVVNFTSSSTVKISSGGGNNFGSSALYTGTGVVSAYGWDLQCDVTKLTRTTGEYCYNTNAAPGSGTLTTVGMVADQGTAANSWFALYSPVLQTY